MDIQQLRYFMSVYETCNYARAAKRLFISRQALRKSMNKLEAELDCVLFENIHNRIMPTKAAYQLYTAALPVVRSYTQLQKVAHQIQNSHSHDVTFGQSRGANAIFIPDEMKKFVQRQDKPHALQLYLIEGTCEEIRNKVLSGEIKYGGIIATSIDKDLFDYQIARSGNVYIALRNDNPLAHKESLSMQDLGKCFFISQGPGFDIHDSLVEIARNRGFDLKIKMMQSDMRSCLRSVEAGLGITYAYYDSQSYPLAPHVVFRPLNDVNLKWMYCAFGKKGNTDPLMLRYFAGKEEAPFQ